ncbi:uncharacterized protein LOC110868788 [Helianthus annuus]|uniref:uncharacterized protein LOC110868788 n=1 Tax=Helianthus annuus TaxID=4232 RepID=UPI000B8F3728|nr:uncharacterized protein LOC110868788 [Helianthus annuus]
MNNHDKQQSVNDRDVDENQKLIEDSSLDAVSGDFSTRRNGDGVGIAARLTDLLAGDNGNDDDDDLLIQRMVMQWLQALDLHVIGACRADERLKPLLKVNVSSGVAEDRLLSHLSQHFEPSELGLLARCLCVPLVSVRVGRIDKQGTLLVPNSARGNLTLSLLPTSDLRISFLGDDGRVEHLSTLRNISDCSSVVIEGISADTSGRSFMIKVPTSAKCFYLWCSEKSRLLGNELLDKMKNLLETKPSLADLTGISDSRLDCFVTHLRTYHVGSNIQVNNTALVSLTGSPSTTSLDLGETGKSSSVDTVSVSSSCTNIPTSNQSLNVKVPELAIDTQMFPLVVGIEVDLDEKKIDPPANVSSTSPISPYYSWCSPVASALQYAVAPSQMMMPMSMAESFTLPPLASLLTPDPSLNLDEIPPFLPEPMVRLPMSIPTSQQIPIFTPLMTDPIVHIPVMDICSSGQTYLMSAGPAMNVTTLMSPLIQETDSMAEKSARDTLRMLISGTSQLPSVLANVDEDQNMGLYGDVNHALANGIAAMGLVSLTEKSGGIMRMCLDQGDLAGETVDSGGTCRTKDNSDLGDGKSK